ncbi:PREDICTED: sugar transport protein 2 [Tarenaya hassleriana]|uniref:Major facilitator superfamily (MFS) profile domain-containing protein n=1 Tax=Tarenaya spinosa TaxID=228870 RepID=B2BXS1_9ROSI|nr:PREDICTED: sugar transport protein 2 [Tarenaya hassleriana]ABW81108.1 unknown [Tarenaya spinosa]
MAGAVMNVEGGTSFPAKTTWQVIVCSIIAACGGLMFGYDIGISGGVTSMDSFLIKFFHTVYEKKHRAHENNYCKFDNQLLQLFTSSLYLAAIFASFAASIVCRKCGRKPTITLASCFFLVGAVLNFFARNLYMLIGGRILLGFGIGFGNQAVPLFISEIAPAKYRGGLNIIFQFLITVGILVASIINFFTSKLEDGWKYSLGGAAVPALILLFGSFFIYETPASLIERGKDKKGLKVLRKIRGVEDVTLEFEEIKRATELANQVKQPYRQLFKRQNLPPFLCGTILQFFQQFTGINVVMFYAPVLFQTMGSGSDSSLKSAVVTNLVNALATIIAICCVDRVGRKALLKEGAAQMTITQCIIGAILFTHLKVVGPIGSKYALVVLILICAFVAGFAWSWGPLGWLVPSEIYPLDVRTAGFFCAVAMNMLCTFIIGQFFLSMMCAFKSFAFFFFGFWNLVMGISVWLFLPETKGIPVDEMAERAWKKHWLWKKFY